MNSSKSQYGQSVSKILLPYRLPWPKRPCRTWFSNWIIGQFITIYRQEHCFNLAASGWWQGLWGSCLRFNCNSSEKLLLPYYSTSSFQDFHYPWEQTQTNSCPIHARAESRMYKTDFSKTSSEEFLPKSKCILVFVIGFFWYVPWLATCAIQNSTCVCLHVNISNKLLVTNYLPVEKRNAAATGVSNLRGSSS